MNIEAWVVPGLFVFYEAQAACSKLAGMVIWGVHKRADGCSRLPRFKLINRRSPNMANDEDALRRRYKEFLDLMPLTIAIAGLPVSESPYNFSPDQMEVRANTLHTAFKLARQLTRDAVTGGQS